MCAHVAREILGGRRGCVVPRRLEHEMDRCHTDWSPDDINRRAVLAAALLIGIGGLFAVAGLSVASAALVAAGRRWYRRVDLPPHEIARLKWQQAKAATGAGAGAWRDTESKVYVPRSARATSSTT
jgi:hypothetical protein